MTPLSERDFQQQILDLAHMTGWETFHVRAGRTADSWRVPGSGTMAKGWVDLVLVHPMQGRIIFVELKTDAGLVTSHQRRVLEVLHSLIDYRPDGTSVVEVWTWRPSQWAFIQETLSERKAA